MAHLQSILDSISAVLWGPFFLVALLLLTGLFLTIRLGGLQFRTLWHALRLGLIDRKDAGANGDISQFQSLMTATASTVGTGNIVGVATAISIGGPGALFWMWVTGLLGMATKYAEAFLAVRFRVTDANGEKSGGPQYYLERGIGGRFGKILAITFAVFATIACFGIGNLTQGNAIATNAEAAWSIPTWVCGVVLSLLVLGVLVGGIRSIGRVTAWLVPLMILLYVCCGVFVLLRHAGELPRAFAVIFGNAFTGSSAVGGFAGSTIMIAMQYGVARGLFSNESGLGSAPIAAAAAQTLHPVRQGLVSMTQTFIDTIIVVSITGLTIVVSESWASIDPLTGEHTNAALMTAMAFEHGLPGHWGYTVVSVSIVLFAFSTLLGWCYYGERNVERLFGVRLVTPYRIVFSLAVFVGCTAELRVVWSFADMANGLMALPNLIGILWLSGLIARETRRYLREDPTIRANKQEIEVFMQEDPGWQAWQQSEANSSH